MPVTVLYISQGLRTKALKPKWLRLPHGLAAGREMEVPLCSPQGRGTFLWKRRWLQTGLYST